MPSTDGCLRISSSFPMAFDVSDLRSTHSALLRSLGLLLLVGGGLALAGCDSGGANSGASSVTGAWQASIETDSLTYNLTFQLQFPDREFPQSRIVGDGEFTAGEETWAFEIPDGRYYEPTLGLTLRFDVEFNGKDLPITIQGTVGDDYQEIEADISGGPAQFEEKEVTIIRP